MGRAVRLRRKANLLFGTGWRASPLLTLACVLAELGSSVFMLAYPLGFRAIVDGATSHQPGRIAVGLAIVAIAYPAGWALSIMGGALNSKLTDLANLHLGLRIGALTSSAPSLEHFERPDYLAEIDTLGERRRTLAGASSQSLGMIRSGIQFGGAAVLLALVWPPLIAVPLLAAAPAIANRRAGKVEKRSDDELADRRRLLSELFSLAATAAPARELRTFGATDGLLARHVRLSNEVNRKALRAARLAAVWEGAGWIIYAAGFAGAILALVLRAAHGAASPGAVVETVSLMRRAQQQVTGASTTAGSFATASTTADRLLWLEDYVAAAVSTGSDPVPERLTSGIRLEHVSFSYPGQDGLDQDGLDQDGLETTVLRDVSLNLSAGSTVAIVGDNGAGKTTLIKLLTGMYRPTLGRITVDGHDLADIAPAQWRTVTTGAFQDFVQFHTTLGDGVGAGDLPRIEDRDAVLGALTQAGAADLPEQLPDGLGTLLGRWLGGRSLSTGQWQRVALARGLMRQRPLLIVLDEPTASLDAPSEAALFTRYREAAARLGQVNGAVTVLVSHRFSTVHIADQIIVMDDGRVAEVGDHPTLIGQDGLYAELFTLQAKAYLGQ